MASAENGTYELRFTMKPPMDFVVLPGMMVAVRNLPDYRNVVSRPPQMPVFAVFRKEGKEFVCEYDPETARLSRRPVEAIRLPDCFMETGSLPAGNRIGAAGGTWLSETHRVTLLNPEVFHAAD